MFRLGIYITDLSMHDVSRDLVLVGTQQSQELTQAFDQVSRIPQRGSKHISVRNGFRLLKTNPTMALAKDVPPSKETEVKKNEQNFVHVFECLLCKISGKGQEPQTGVGGEAAGRPDQERRRTVVTDAAQNDRDGDSSRQEAE